MVDEAKAYVAHTSCTRVGAPHALRGTTHPIQHVLTPTSYTHTHTSTHTAFTLSRRVSFDSAQLQPVYTIVPGNGHCCFIVVPAPNVTRLLRVRPTHIYHVCSTRPHVPYNCHTHPSHTRRHTQHYSQTHTHTYTLTCRQWDFRSNTVKRLPHLFLIRRANLNSGMNRRIHIAASPCGRYLKYSTTYALTHRRESLVLGLSLRQKRERDKQHTY